MLMNKRRKFRPLKWAKRAGLGLGLFGLAIVVGVVYVPYMVVRTALMFPPQ